MPLEWFDFCWKLGRTSTCTEVPATASARIKLSQDLSPIMEYTRSGIQQEQKNEEKEEKRAF